MEEAHRLCELSYEKSALQLNGLRRDFEVVQEVGGKIYFARNESRRWLVFRGTYDGQDVIDDLKVSPTEVSPLCQGAAHSGFVQRASLAPNVPPEKTMLVVTGHSLGGAAAQTWTVKRLLQGTGEPVVCLTFGAPFLVDGALQANLRHEMRTAAFVTLVNPGDPVPVLPRVVHEYMSPAGHLGIMCGEGNVRWITDPLEQKRVVQVRQKKLEDSLGHDELQQLKLALDSAHKFGPRLEKAGLLRRLATALKSHRVASYNHRSKMHPSVQEMYGLPLRRCHKVELPTSAPASAAAKHNETAFEKESLSRLPKLHGKGAQVLTQMSAIKSKCTTHFAPEVLGFQTATDNPANEQRQLFHSMMDGDVVVETAFATTNDPQMPHAPHAVHLRIRNHLSNAISCMIPAGTVFEQPQWNKCQNVATQHAEVVHVPAMSAVGAVLPALCMNEQYDCPKHDNVNITPFAARETGAVRDQVALWQHMAAVFGCSREQLIFGW